MTTRPTPTLDADALFPSERPGVDIYPRYRRRLTSQDEREQGRERDDASIDFDATMWPQPGAVMEVPEGWEEDLTCK